MDGIKSAIIAIFAFPSALKLLLAIIERAKKGIPISTIEKYEFARGIIAPLAPKTLNMGIFKKIPNKIALKAKKMVSAIWLLKDNNAFLTSPPPNDLETILPPPIPIDIPIDEKRNDIGKTTEIAPMANSPMYCPTK